MNNEQATKAALELASNWFNVHSDQRIRLMNLYVILLVGFLAVVGAEKFFQEPYMMLISGIVFAMITFIFKRLDMRTAQLVKIAEVSINEIEEKIGTISELKKGRLILATDSADGIPTYRQSFNLLFFTGGFLGVATSLWALVKISCG